MAQCKHCGKKGFFLKVNSDGFCADCVRIVKLQSEELEIQKRIENLKTAVEDPQRLYDSIAEKAKTEALQSITDHISQSYGKLLAITLDLKNKHDEYAALSASLEQANKSLVSSANKAQKIKTLYKSMEYALSHYSHATAESLDFLVPDLISDLDAELEPTIKINFHFMDVKQLRSKYNQLSKQIEELLLKYKDRYTTKSNIALYQLMVIALKAELQNVLYNITFGKLDDSVSAIKSITAKYLKIATDGNQHIAPIMSRFIGELESLFIDAVNIEYEYYAKKEQIKEEQRALREQMRQEAEERKQLEIQRKQVEKEESKYKSEMASINEQLEQNPESDKVSQLTERLRQLEEQLHAVSEKKEEILHLQNGKAGYVYVISNLGSFGDHTFKVGMTRRLEPQERVNELGDASVPFPFDVHCFIFSDDAVGLESNMHKILNNKRVNKVNLRKEFFNVSIDELEDLVYSLQPSSEFKRTMLAEQYNQSLSIDEVAESPDETDDEGADSEDISA